MNPNSIVGESEGLDLFCGPCHTCSLLKKMKSSSDAVDLALIPAAWASDSCFKGLSIVGDVNAFHLSSGLYHSCSTSINGLSRRSSVV